MNTLLSVDEFVLRVNPAGLPQDDMGNWHLEKISLALDESVGIIVSHLPWLLEASGEIITPIPAQFAQTLKAVCRDIAVYRLTDMVSSSEDDRKRYESSIALLKTIASEHKGGLYGPDCQTASLIEPNDQEQIADHCFFKKGLLY